MKVKQGQWYEVIVRCERESEDGQVKTVTEQYTFAAQSFGDAETMAYKEIGGDCAIKNINPASYNEVVLSDNEGDDKWFKTKVSLITIDERTEKEKKDTVSYLIQGQSLERARKYADELMKGSILNYELKSVVESKTLDVFWEE